MRSLPPAAAAFVFAVVASGALVLAGGAARLPALLGQGAWGVSEVAEVALFLALAVLAELRRLPLGQQASVSVGCAVNCAAAIVLGPDVASWTAALSMGAVDVVRGRAHYKAAFNAATLGLAIAA